MGKYGIRMKEIGGYNYWGDYFVFIG